MSFQSSSGVLGSAPYLTLSELSLRFQVTGYLQFVGRKSMPQNNLTAVGSIFLLFPMKVAGLRLTVSRENPQPLALSDTPTLLHLLMYWSAMRMNECSWHKDKITWYLTKVISRPKFRSHNSNLHVQDILMFLIFDIIHTVHFNTDATRRNKSHTSPIGLAGNST